LQTTRLKSVNPKFYPLVRRNTNALGLKSTSVLLLRQKLPQLRTLNAKKNTKLKMFSLFVT